MFCLRTAGIATAVALFPFAKGERAQVFSQSVTHQRRAVAPGAASRLICRPQELFVEHDLHCFHMWSLVHNRLHNQEGASFSARGFDPVDAGQRQDAAHDLHGRAVFAEQGDAENGDRDGKQVGESGELWPEPTYKRRASSGVGTNNERHLRQNRFCIYVYKPVVYCGIAAAGPRRRAIVDRFCASGYSPYFTGTQI